MNIDRHTVCHAARSVFHAAAGIAFVMEGAFIDAALAMKIDRHSLCHAALGVVHAAACIAFVVEGAFVDAALAITAAIIYGLMTHHPDDHPPASRHESATKPTTE